MDSKLFFYERYLLYPVRFHVTNCFVNRHHSDYSSQIIQGESHLTKIGKRMLYEKRRYSDIEDLHFMKSP